MKTKSGKDARKPHGYWTYERCLAVARKCSSKVEFQNSYKNAYDAAHYHGWLDRLTIDAGLREQRYKWTYDECLEEALKYGTMWEFTKNCVNAYAMCRRHGWLGRLYDDTGFEKPVRWDESGILEEIRRKGYVWWDEFRNGSASAHNAACRLKILDKLPLKRRLHVPWTPQTAMDEARKYRTRGEFERGSSGAYQYMKVNGLLDLCTHFEKAYNPYTTNRCRVYCYLFEGTDRRGRVLRHAYVGLTTRKSPDERDREHRTGTGKMESSVRKFARRRGVPVPEMRILEEDLPVTGEGCVTEREDFWRRKLESEGWTMLNKAKTGKCSGSLGGTARKWTRPRILEAAARCSTNTEFQKAFPGAFTAARRLGIPMRDLGFRTRDEITRKVASFFLDGTFECMYENPRNAGIAIIGSRSTIIAEACKGRRPQAYGRLWRYATEEDLERLAAGNPIFWKGDGPLEKPVPFRTKRFYDGIFQVDKSGTVVARFRNPSEAQRATGISSSNIGMVLLRKRKTAGGFFWREDQSPEDTPQNPS